MVSKSCIGIVTATVPEAKMLAPIRHIKPGEVFALPGDAVKVIVSGMGHEAATNAFHTLNFHGITTLISWGTACALVGQLKSGQLLLPKAILNPKHQVQPVSQDLHEVVHSKLRGHVSIETGDLIQSDKVLTSPQQRGFLAQSGAMVADMESYALATLAHQHQIPFLAVRCVVDELDSQLPHSCVKAVGKDGQINVGRLMAGLIGHPTEVSDLWQLMRKYSLVKKQLRTVWPLLNTVLADSLQAVA